MRLYEELGEFAETLTGPNSRMLSFGRPRVLVRHPDDLCGNPCGAVSVYEAGLTLTNADDPDVVITVAHADLLFVTFDTNGDIDRELSNFHREQEPEWDPPADPAWYATMGNALAALTPDEQERMDSIIIVRDMFVDPAFREHRLGPALITGLAADNPMGATSLLIGWPRFWGDEREPTEARAYWQSTLPLRDLDDGFLGALSDSEDLLAVHHRLGEQLQTTFIAVDPAELWERFTRRDEALWPRSLVLDHIHRAPAGFAEVLEEVADAARIVASAREFDEETTARLTAAVTFYGDDQSHVFYQVGDYLEENPQYVVRSVNLNVNEEVGFYSIDVTMWAPPQE